MGREGFCPFWFFAGAGQGEFHPWSFWKLRLRLGGSSEPGFQCLGPQGKVEFSLVACVSLRLEEGWGDPTGENSNQWVLLKWK